MTDEKIQIAIPGDDEGYIALRCPHCAADFKLLAGVLNEFDGTELFCASCGLSHELSRFLLHPDVEKVAMAEAENLAADLVNEWMAGLERQFRGSKFLKVSGTKLPRKPVPTLRAITDLVETELPCCETRVKLTLDVAATVFYCPLCGHAQN